MSRDKIRAAIAANDFGADGLGGDLQPNEIDTLTDAVLAALTSPCTCREDVVCGARVSGATDPATAQIAPPADDVREALIEGVKLEARNLMRSDSRVWHEALESALDKTLPGFWAAATQVRPRGPVTDAEIVQEAYRRYDGDTIIDENTGEPTSHDDWGYAECQRQAFAAGVAWAWEAQR